LFSVEELGVPAGVRDAMAIENAQREMVAHGRGAFNDLLLSLPPSPIIIGSYICEW